MVSGEIHIYRGIPYGADTGGNRRFHPAQAARWTGVRGATEHGPIAPQHNAGLAAPPHVSWLMDPRAQSEDCLSLNIFTPQIAGGSPLPVMAYLHGGGFMVGSGSAPGLDGTNLARRGVVVVSLNHRLNLFGHLYLGDRVHGEYADSGNIGLLDLLAALQWVQDNIAQFGGDPTNITLFGQSGGGSKIGALMAMPRAQGLFHRAIIQSASSLLRLATIDEAERNTYYFLRALGIEGSGTQRLWDLPAQHLLKAMRQAVEDAGRIDNYRPVIDGRTLVDQPFTAATAPGPPDVPLLMGWCETEQRLTFSTKPGEFRQTQTQARARIAGYLGVSDAEAAHLLAVYSSGRQDDTPGDLMALIYGDHRYRRAVTQVAELRSRQERTPTYVYLLRWRTPVLDELLRSPHTLCLPFVFDNLNIGSGLTGSGPEQLALRTQMSRAWVEFARRGNPNHDQLPEWNPYSEGRRQTMILDRDSQLEDDPASQERIALQTCPPYIPAEAEGGRRR